MLVVSALQRSMKYSMKSSLDINIKTASLTDEQEIIYLIHEALKSNEGFFLPLAPTLENAKMFFRLEIIPCIINQDPTYIAFENSKPIGFSCCSLGVNTAYDLTKTIALGILTTTIPSYRSQGVATQLRERMLQDLKQKGITTVMTDITDSNLASLQSCEKIMLDKQLEWSIISHRL